MTRFRPGELGKNDARALDATDGLDAPRLPSDSPPGAFTLRLNSTILRPSARAGLRAEGCGKIAAMAKNQGQFEVACPCCGALLKIDIATRAVIAHTPKAVPKTFDDIEAAARAMKEHDSRKESIFRQSVEAQKNQADVLEKKFQEALRRAKETPDTGKPLRDFDLD